MKYLEDFSNVYNNVVEYYNERNFKLFFREIRISVEYFGKFLINDIIQNESDADAIINGTKSFIQNSNKSYSLSNQEPSQEPEGSFFITLARISIYSKNPHLINNKGNSKYKRLKSDIDTGCSILINMYNTASELAVHTGISSKNIVDQANSCMSAFPKIFDDFRRVVSEENSDFLLSLKKPNIQSESQSGEVQVAEIRDNDFFLLDSITNKFDQQAGVEYVAFIPEDITDEYGKALSVIQLHDFFKLHWNFIVDFNKKMSDGIYEQAPSDKKSSIRIITDNLSEVTGTSNLTNWMFAKGRHDLDGFDNKGALRTAPQLFSKTFTKIVKTGITSDFLIFDFCESFSKLTIRLLDKLEDVFGSWEVVKERCKIISFSQDLDHCESLKEWSENFDIDVVFISAGFPEFLNHISQLKPQLDNCSNKFLIRSNTLNIAESKERYHAAGIDFFGPTMEVPTDRVWDFYSGAEITWTELDNHHDVQREQYIIVKRRIYDILKTMRRSSIYTLRHRPGSGATTLSRRLAFDFKKEDELGTLTCTVIEIKNSSNLRMTEQYLRQLSEKIENTPILAIVESKRVIKEKFDLLVKRISDAGKKILFFYVEPYTGYPVSKKDMILLDSSLKKSEQARFEEKYIQQGLQDTLLMNLKKKHKVLEVIDFPLMLKDRESSNNIGSYVKEWMDELPENLIKFCAYVGFVSKYSDLGVNQTLLKSIWKDGEHYSLRSYGDNLFNVLKKILIEITEDDGTATGIWPPRYNCFAEFILNAYKINWRSGLSEIAKNFIKLCEEVGEIASIDKDMLYSVFVIRKNADYRAIEDKTVNFKNKFSLLIRDLDDTERAESLFVALVDAFPNDPLFRGHYARFLYEKASLSKEISTDDRLFVDAQEQLNFAFELNPDDSDLHHMQGMLIRRKMTILYKLFERQRCEDSLDNINIDEYLYCIEEWTKSASDAFEKSIQLSPASPYGYAAESQLYMEAIKFGQQLLDSDDYLFCENNPLFCEYTEKLGYVLDLFEQICYAFKNEGLSQIMGAYPIYEKVRTFHENVIGQSKESVKKYRKMYSRSSDDKKILYGNLLVKSILYSKSNKQNTRLAYKYLTTYERQEIESVLEFQISRGELKSYETLFMLKLYSYEEFSIDKAIDLLKEWEQQFTEESQLGWGYLNACFYLAVCYAAKAIQSNIPNRELSSLVTTYFKKSEEFARRFDKGTVMPQCYLGERNDIHCIVDKNYKDQEARTVTGVIKNISNNKGILKMRCGINVSFNAKGFDVLYDEGRSLRGVLGFSYSGAGLYDFARDGSSDCNEIYDVLDEKDISYDELNASYTSNEDEENEIPICLSNNQPKVTIGPKIVGKVDESVINRGKRVQGQRYTKDTVVPLNKSGKNEGKINKECTRVYCSPMRCWLIIDKDAGFKKDCSPKDYDYIANEMVKYEVRESINPKTGNTFYFAVNVSPSSEE